MSDEDEMTFIEDEEADALIDEPIDETVEKLAKEAEEKVVNDILTEEESMKTSGANEANAERDLEVARRQREADKAMAEKVAKEAAEVEEALPESLTVTFTTTERGAPTIEKTLASLQSVKYMYNMTITRDGTGFEVVLKSPTVEHVETIDTFLRQHAKGLMNVKRS